MCTNFPYDVAAAALIVQEAGGVVTHADGRSLDDHPADRLVPGDGLAVLAAARRELHEALLAAVDRGMHRLRGSLGRKGGEPVQDGRVRPASGASGQRAAHVDRRHRRSACSSSCSSSSFIVSYNGLVRPRNRIDNAWSQIDVQLKRRHDLIPNLVETVKGYAAHERGTLRERSPRPGPTPSTPQGPGAAGPGRERPERRAEEPVRGGRGLPRPQGEPELPEPPGGADVDRGPHRLRAAVLQRQRARATTTRSRRSRATSSPACSTSTSASSSRATPRQQDRSRSSSEPRSGHSLGARRAGSDSDGSARAAPPMYEQIARNKRRTFLLLFVFVAAHRRGRRRVRLPLRGSARSVVVVAIVIAIAMAWGSYFNSDKVALAASRAKPADGPEYRALPQPRRRALHRGRAPEAAALRGRRPRAERVRHRPQPQARRRSRSPPGCSRR